MIYFLLHWAGVCGKRILLSGGVSEWFKEAVLKTVEPLRVPWVRILPPPPYNQERWPSGRRRSPAKRVSGLKLLRGFKSHPLRHFNNCQCDFPRHAPVAQLDRVTGYEPGGRGFESLRARHFINQDFNFAGKAQCFPFYCRRGQKPLKNYIERP